MIDVFWLKTTLKQKSHVLLSAWESFLALIFGFYDAGWPTGMYPAWPGNFLTYVTVMLGEPNFT
jgi:hypothetical protein